MKILVTGAVGFIGSHLAERFCSKGHTVIGLDNFSPYYSVELKKLNAKAIEEKGCRVIECDLSKDDLSSLVSSVDVLYHLAAQPGISSSVSFEDYNRNNVIATYRLLEACSKVPGFKLFANISTSSVYGKFACDTEETVPKPVSYYGVTKLAAEQLALSYQRNKGLPVTSVRLFSVYGERERPEKLFPKLIRSILESTPFPIFEGSMDHQRSFTYITDIIDGLELALENASKCIGEIFNLGCDMSTRTGDNIGIIEEVLGKKAIFEVKPRRLGDQEKTQANIEKARRFLGYEPKILPEDGLKKEALWYKEKIFGRVKDLSFSS